MKKFLFFLFIIFSATTSFAQSDLVFKGYFSYNEIKDVSESSSKVFAASENALFQKDVTTNEIKTVSTIDGLSGETISAIYHSEIFNKTLVGYESGLLIVINEKDGTMYRAIGILQKEIPSNIKKINHFSENNGFAYISCKFGIVQFNLNTSEFGDTYFLGTTVSNYVEVAQTTVFNNAIYAMTLFYGIIKGDLSNPNLNDYSQWTSFNAGYWNGIATINNQIVASNTNNTFYKFVGNVSVPFYTNYESTVDFRVYNNQLIATGASKVMVFNDQLLQTTQVNKSDIPDITSNFTCATAKDGMVYIGTKEDGLYTTTTTNPTVFENITPDGPTRNAVFALNATTDNFWAVYGGYAADYNPYTYNSYNVNTYGISKFTDAGWQNKPFSTVLGAKALCKIVVNPKNKTEVYVSSFFSGLLKLVNDIPTVLYNQTNSSLETLQGYPPDPNYIDIRVNGTVFDKSGNLWITNSLIPSGLKVLKTDGTWGSVSMENILDDYSISYFGNIVVDKNGTKWIATSQDGVVGYNENGNLQRKITVGADLGNLPAKGVRAVAIDNKNQLWIGTTNGLRVLSSVDSFLSTQPMIAKPIIILEDNLAQELFYEQTITDVVVDGANRKWIATADSGVFLVSANGQETIYHFTTANSPLPSNTILDVDINSDSGEVFFATNKGMISFKGTSTRASENLENVYIYPNPVRPEFSGTVKISGLIDKANIKITDIQGNLVFETTSEGGTIEWDTTAFGKYKVASGVYMVFIAGKDGVETKVKKVMIVR